MSHIATLHTIGDGLWSGVERRVRITKLDVPYLEKDDEWCELRVYFNTEDWDVNKFGLIYTDSLFEYELIELLKSLGYGADVGYSEQGMQGDDYVSLDANEEFTKSWMEKHGCVA